MQRVQLTRGHVFAAAAAVAIPLLGVAAAYFVTPATPGPSWIVKELPGGLGTVKLPPDWSIPVFVAVLESFRPNQPARGESIQPPADTQTALLQAFTQPHEQLLSEETVTR